ncbi:MAG: N-acetylmuramoyl-L-alanine amidase [Candidatus Brocadiae bacterium]|nr:N-acetylmuramoyl-L-alanine amidase [Candidatus Brocadiia bacterium]
MTLRPRPVRVVLLVAALVCAISGILVSGPGADPPPPMKALVQPVPVPGRAVSPVGADPPEPFAGIPFAPIVPIPESLSGIAGALVQPETREWKSIIVHHSASLSGNAAEFDKLHREERGWDMLGYQFVIGNGDGAPAGGVEVGPRWLRQLHGAHAGEEFHNAYGIGICVVGNYMDHEMPEGVYAALRDLTCWLARRYSITPDRILGHSQVRVGGTECPGVRFPLERLRADAAAALRK